MINSRDEPHADGAKYRRLHVIVGDSNMAHAATYFKVGATAMLIRAAAEGLVLPDFELRDPPAAIREVAHGWRTAHPVELADGRRIRPAEIQAAFYETAQAAADARGPVSAEEEFVLDLWRRALRAWERLDFDGLETELDWLAKWRLIERYRERTGASLDDPRVLRLELAYHQLGLGLNEMRAKLEAGGNLWRGIGHGDISWAVSQPPAGTRARLRGRFVAAASGAGREYTVDWVRLKLGQDVPVAIMDPLDATNAAAERLIERAGPPGPVSGQFGEILALAGR
jgi:proteasome accessory factor A